MDLARNAGLIHVANQLPGTGEDALAGDLVKPGVGVDERRGRGSPGDVRIDLKGELRQAVVRSCKSKAPMRSYGMSAHVIGSGCQFKMEDENQCPFILLTDASS
jgi:hypothetical protein